MLCIKYASCFLKNKYYINKRLSIGYNQIFFIEIALFGES